MWMLLEISLRSKNARMESSSMLEIRNILGILSDTRSVGAPFLAALARSGISLPRVAHPNPAFCGVRVEKISPGTRPLLADAELGDHTFIALGIVFLEVVEQATPLADQHEKPAARTVVFLVRLEVLRQLANAFAEQRDLHLGTSGVGRMRAIAVNYGSLLLSG
jgi:hypothetical protein